ncbi:hypothetical protein [Lysinibacillus sp. TE18511]
MTANQFPINYAEALGQQMFFVRKRSVSNRCFLCESEASATDVICAKAKRQQQMLFVRKPSANVAAATG